MVRLLPLIVATVCAQPFTPDTGHTVVCSSPGDVVCGDHGTCSANRRFPPTNHSCTCDREWFTPSINGNATCGTMRPSQAIAVGLQVGFGWIGAGAYYLGWNLVASIQLVAMTVACFIGILCQWCKSPTPSANNYLLQRDGSDRQFISACGCCSVIITSLTMWILCLVSIISNCHNKQGVPCTPI